MTASDIFAAHALALRWTDIPHAAQQATRIFLTDTLAVGAAGRRAPFRDQVVRAIAGGEAGAGPVLGSAERLPAAAASFVNAFQIHAQEFDCVHENAVLHPLSATLGALIGTMGRWGVTGGVTGAEFGAALVAGVDISVALGLASQAKLTFFRPASAGIFGATAALGRVFGLSQAQLVSAFGHALSFASGTMQAHIEGTPGLPLQVGAAARSAVLAVDLAVAGVPGARGAIDGDFGYLALFERTHDLAPVLARLGQDFRIAELSTKPFPTGRAAQGALAGLREILADGTRVAGLVYHAPPLIARLVGRPTVAGMSVNYARLCLPFLAATMILHGRVDLESFSPARLQDPAVLALAAHVTVLADHNPDPAAFVPALLRAELVGGGVRELAVTSVLGHPGKPLEGAARMEKLRNCLTFAGLPHAADAFAERVWGFAELDDVAPVLMAATLETGETA